MVFESKKITAREACRQTKIGYKENCLRKLNQAYESIENAANQGISKLSLYYHDFVMANKIFAELTSQGYCTDLTYDDERWKLEVSWSIFDVDLDPNKKYILLMDDTRNEFGQVCAILDHGQTSDSWTFKYVNNMSEAINFGYTVTAKDIEEAPEWVKALEPVEVEE